MYRLPNIRTLISILQSTEQSAASFSRCRTLSFSCARRAAEDSEDGEKKDVAPRSIFDMKEKTKNNYIDMIRKFNERSVQKRGQVEFVYAAMNYMDEFGVSKDLSVYKALIETFPKGKMIPRNMFQSEFMHYPKHQQCAIDLLEKMENNGVMPDMEVEVMLKNVFGKTGHPVRKFMRMYYWMPKFSNLSPWPLPKPVPEDPWELAKLALQRITSVDLLTKIDSFKSEELEDAIDKTWILSAQSPLQKEILERLPSDEPLYVEGAFTIWLRQTCVNYFVLRGKPRGYKPHKTLDEIDDVSDIESPYYGDESAAMKSLEPLRTVHEQIDGTIIAVAATGTSSKDSLLSWIRFLQKSNPALDRIPVLFSVSSPFGQVVPFQEEENVKEVKST